jgi:transposase
MLLADRGYDADWIRALAANRGAWANIPRRSNRNDPICFSPYLYRARNLVERFCPSSATSAPFAKQGNCTIHPLQLLLNFDAMPKELFVNPLSQVHELFKVHP